MLLLVMLITVFPVTASAGNVFEGDDRIVVVLDPGHGGYDPGASRNGVTEESWSLSVAREIKAILEENGNFIVYMTRNSDTFLSIAERGIIANKYNADLLFSIHFDSNGSTGVRGATFITSIFDKYAVTGLGNKVLSELGTKNLVLSEYPLSELPEKPLIIGNIRMGFGHYRISMAFASCAKALG